MYLPLETIKVKCLLLLLLWMVHPQTPQLFNCTKCTERVKDYVTLVIYTQE